MPEPGFEPGSGAPQAPRISKLPHSGAIRVLKGFIFMFWSFFSFSP